MIAAVAVAASAAAAAEELTVPSRPRLPSDVRGDLFASPRPVVRAPKKTAPVVAPKPSAPPFPYKYGGRVTVGNEAARIYLQKGSELLEIKKGGMLDDAWRVDAVSEDRIEVSFVPLGQQLSMSLASLTSETTAQTTTAQGNASPGAIGAAGRALASQPQPAARSGTATESAASTVPPMIGGVVPSAAPLRQPSPRAAVSAAPATGPISSPMQPGPVPQTEFPSLPPPTGRLGDAAPSSGSMPTGAAQGATTGKKLGLE